MIKAILFDYDGVITPGVDVKLPAKKLASGIDISYEEASELIKSIWDGYSTGSISIDEVWSNIESQLDKKVSTEKRDIWHKWDELKPIPFMLELVRDLRSRGYKVGLLSNVFRETAELIRRNGGYKGFDFTILSCEVGTRKPDRKIYEKAMEKLDGIHVDEIVFLDDREHSIKGAQEFGLNTIYVTDHKKAIKKVYELIDGVSS